MSRSPFAFQPSTHSTCPYCGCFHPIQVVCPFTMTHDPRIPPRPKHEPRHHQVIHDAHYFGTHPPHRAPPPSPNAHWGGPQPQHFPARVIPPVITPNPDVQPNAAAHRPWKCSVPPLAPAVAEVPSWAQAAPRPHKTPAPTSDSEDWVDKIVTILRSLGISQKDAPGPVQGHGHGREDHDAHHRERDRQRPVPARRASIKYHGEVYYPDGARTQGDGRSRARSHQHPRDRRGRSRARTRSESRVYIWNANPGVQVTIKSRRH
ncbi:hypothetical protein BJ138DRAFT_582906 [Hygrophoropsis aurantiaca]|uniref:Uncharacterized protein n=1 Tax=Hygrophoropsis aurantiaca TaxID=72124 RepID=A0ACB8AKU5_9AGAM|nr:hypothetical protein BJ138DRAFT_582906 [Hygrophoropsis aurantiaca]